MIKAKLLLYIILLRHEGTANQVAHFPLANAGYKNKQYIFGIEYKIQKHKNKSSKPLPNAHPILNNQIL